MYDLRIFDLLFVVKCLKRQEICTFCALFFFFERKVTKNFLYLQRISVLIKVKSEKWEVKTELYQDRKAILLNKDCKSYI